MAELMPFAEQERSDLLGLAESLTPEQWAAPSLCEDWSVRDVVTHVVSYDELSVPQTVTTFLRGGLRPATVNEVALRRYAELEPADVVRLVAACRRPRGLPSAMGGGVALTDGTIHHQDVRRALGMPRVIPRERLVPVLDFSLRAPTLPSRSNVTGLRLVAEDIGWTAGHGPEVVGPGEALLMAAAGRAVALDELRGEGLATLRRRVGGTAAG
ncbi:maleylpyruvate isomerase family mycothiol-dependent enzyme [Nocardioides sp. zg-1308]|uniref:maleylpyruvate isomerase family mycothiol-dependent enzyme n=1 Tax=Nocardioides sp. zg-1308 TaxID=2736253 RepID=UPI001C12FBA4|nr:maleylpyruvate isomerase family mycothiol-dependent enzyme [Nocardioides sp. zg-1308]